MVPETKRTIQEETVNPEGTVRRERPEGKSQLEHGERPRNERSIGQVRALAVRKSQPYGHDRGAGGVPAITTPG